MTDKVNPSVNRPAEAFKTAGAIGLAGGISTGYVSPGNSPSEIAQQDSGIDATLLNAFQEYHDTGVYPVGSETGSPQSLGSDGTYFWVLGGGTAYQYDDDWYYTGTSHDLTGQDASPQSIHFDGTNWYMAGSSTATVYEYDSTFAATGNSFGVGTEDGTPESIFWDGTNYFMVGSGTDSVYEYDSTWTATGTSYDISTETTTPESLHYDGTNWYLSDGGSTIYEYDGTFTLTTTGSYSVSGTHSSVTGIILESQFGTNYWFIVGTGNDEVHRYDSGLSGAVTDSKTVDVTIDPGESFVYGSWLGIDDYTKVSLSSSTNNQVVYVGWNKDGSDDVIVGTDAAFANASGDTDMKIPLWEFDTDASGVSAAREQRVIGKTVDGRHVADTNTTSAAYTTSSEQIIFVDTSGGPVTVTLSTADAVNGSEVIIVDSGGSADSNIITVDTESGETIDGQNSVTISANYGAQRLASDGANWFSAGGGGAALTVEDDQTEILDTGNVSFQIGAYVLDDGDGSVSINQFDTRDPRM